MVIKEAQWFTVDYPQVGGHMRDMFDNYKVYKNRAKRQAAISTKEFSWEGMRDLLGERLDELVPEIAKTVELKLPTLSKLPKLK